MQRHHAPACPVPDPGLSLPPVPEPTLAWLGRHFAPPFGRWALLLVETNRSWHTHAPRPPYLFNPLPPEQALSCLMMGEAGRRTKILPMQARLHAPADSAVWRLMTTWCSGCLYSRTDRGLYSRVADSLPSAPASALPATHRRRRRVATVSPQYALLARSCWCTLGLARREAHVAPSGVPCGTRDS